MRRAAPAIAALLVSGCAEPAAAPAGAAAPVGAPARIDMHVHLVEDAVLELLAALDRKGIGQAVVLASPHLDPAHPPAGGEDRFEGCPPATELLLAQTSSHRDRRIPFVTVAPPQVKVSEAVAAMVRGASVAKLY